uniref:F-box and regulator of chromosome condensation repeat protein n=1 Tax=Pithovirus LCPAC102 TaxID=2506587 RepID=A0A481Z3Z5_9VIRU|nr:MAG: F-box and regulator of chromosome condensation repeat protein [Pithovirus LCPAC102]
MDKIKQYLNILTKYNEQLLKYFNILYEPFVYTYQLYNIDNSSDIFESIITININYNLIPYITKNYNIFKQHLINIFPSDNIILHLFNLSIYTNFNLYGALTEIPKVIIKLIFSIMLEDKITIMPTDPLYKILYNLPYIDIKQFCSTSIKAQFICKDNLFWLNKFINDFNYNPIISTHTELNGDMYNNTESMYLHYGLLWSTGDNYAGELAMGDNEDRNKFEMIDYKFRTKPNYDNNTNIYEGIVSCGTYFTFFIYNKYLYTSGDNILGNVGLLYPVKNPIIDDNIVEHTVKYVSSGENHIVIIDDNNKLWSAGLNSFGQLGSGDYYNRESFKKILFIDDNIEIKSVTCGYEYTIAIDMDNIIWVFGNNNYGQLGFISGGNIIIPTKLNIFGYDMKAKYVSCGHNHTIIIDMDNNAWSFGQNNKGQLGLGHTNEIIIPNMIENINDIKMSSCGHSQSLLLTNKGDIYSFGLNNYGKLGLSYTNLNKIVNVPTQIKLQNKIIYISSGSHYAIIIDDTNTLYGFGRNDIGQLGIGINLDSISPVIIEFENNNIIEFENNNIIEFENNNIFKQKIAYISCGHSHSVAISMY